MKFLAYFLAVIVITESSHWNQSQLEAEELRINADYAGNNIHKFGREFGHLRKYRLRKISERFLMQRHNVSETERTAEQMFLRNIVSVNMSSSLAALDLYTLNDASGISEYLFQGDILLTDGQLDSIERQLEDVDENGRSKRQASTFKKWTNNRVVFYFRPQTTARVKNIVRHAVNYLRTRTCLTFQESATAANRIGVFMGAGCYSTVGMAGGEQPLSLGYGCSLLGTVLHELFHALGIWHMHMRTDRDKHITLKLAAVQATERYNFQKLQANQQINYTPYEYGSMMHYGADSFAIGNGISMVPKNPAYLYTLGGPFATFFDIHMINRHYRCYTKCKKALGCKNGGHPNPANCNMCNCPTGYGGKLCNQRPPGCGTHLRATAAWKSQTVRLGKAGNDFRDIPDVCNYWINAPKGAKIQVKLMQLTNLQCQYGCSFNGVEFKTGPILHTNPRICCPEFFNRTYVSNKSPTPVILYNHFRVSVYTFSYRILPGSAGK